MKRYDPLVFTLLFLSIPFVDVASPLGLGAIGAFAVSYTVLRRVL